MHHHRNWLVDFDDTLVVGLTTWGYTQAIPALIQQYHLSFDQAQFEAAMLVAQEQANKVKDPTPVIDEFLSTMKWPEVLRMHLIQAMSQAYHPELFADAIPFLMKLQQAGQTVYIVSNNPRTPDLAEQLGVMDFVEQVFTPKLCPGTYPKPHCSLLKYISDLNPGVNRFNTVVVGDDPWSDGAFAKNCNLKCWLVDRQNRFESHTMSQAFFRVQSLLDIPLPS